MNKKITHTAEKVKELAHSLQHISPCGYSTPADVVRILDDLSRETLYYLAKHLQLHRGTTTTRDELIRMIAEQYSKNYWNAMRPPKVYAKK